MSLLTLANITHAYGTQRVLDGATLSIDAGEKIGLVGRNGTGKSTLMRVMLGQLSPDSGAVQLAKGSRVGYLSQDPEFDPNDTVRDAAERAFAKLHDLHVQMNEVYEQMATATPDELERLMKKQSRLEADIEAEGGYAIDHKIDATLHGLGFTDDQFKQSVGSLSGGQKGRLGLARLLLESPDLLLLDEPTNHLDIAGRQWLEDFLAEEFPGAVVVVSHDRWLLDRVVNRILEVERGAVRQYPGNYHKYLELRHERQLTEARVYDKQQDKIRQEQQFIRRYKTGQRAKQARGRQSRLDRFIRDEVMDRPIELEVMRLKLPKAPRSGDQVLSARGLRKAYGDLVLFDSFDLDIARGERIGIIGPNGVGKTTLVKSLLGELDPDSGEVRRGTRLAVGYYRQIPEHIDLSLSVWQYLQSVIVSEDGQTRASEQQARDLAGAFLFSGSEQDKALADLSGGERSRCVIAGLVASAKNLLVLDEPTNHLDIPSAERLERVLSREGGYDGTLILISHDRTLLDTTCDRLIIFDDPGSVRVFPGGYSEWLHHQKQATASRKQAAAETPRPAAAKAQPRREPKPEGIAAWSVGRIEQAIEAIERRRDEIDELMTDPEVYTDGERMGALKAERKGLESDLEPLEMEWTRRADGS